MYPLSIYFFIIAGEEISCKKSIPLLMNNSSQSSIPYPYTIKWRRGKVMIHSRRFKAGILLILLAILDSLFTDFGLRNNYITEANPLMRVVYEASVFGFYLIKISLPFLLLYLLAKIELKKYFQFLLGCALVLYSFVLCQHLIWLSLV